MSTQLPLPQRILLRRTLSECGSSDSEGWISGGRACRSVLSFRVHPVVQADFRKGYSQLLIPGVREEEIKPALVLRRVDKDALVLE